jgi:hypothetical protein
MPVGLAPSQVCPPHSHENSHLTIAWNSVECLVALVGFGFDSADRIGRCCLGTCGMQLRRFASVMTCSERARRGMRRME